MIIEDSPQAVKNLNETLDALILNGDTLGSPHTVDGNGKSAVWLRSAVERAILHAHVWHTQETKLPRRFCPNLPIWKHKAEFGIHPQSATRFLFHNLFRILELQVDIFSLTNTHSSVVFSLLKLMLAPVPVVYTLYFPRSCDSSPSNRYVLFFGLLIINKIMKISSGW